ncbi:uncharacterized protein J3R85_006671 [Psidium guajava]|nr:uncharacterized protein J3R85_006671 [Psidium guajava]
MLARCSFRCSFGLCSVLAQSLLRTCSVLCSGALSVARSPSAPLHARSRSVLLPTLITSLLGRSLNLCSIALGRPSFLRLRRRSACFLLWPTLPPPASDLVPALCSSAQPMLCSGAWLALHFDPHFVAQGLYA